MVVKELKLDDIRALRLTSRTVCNNVKESSFKEYFQKKTLLIGTQPLLKFVALTRDSDFPSLVENLELEPHCCDVTQDLPNKDMTQLQGNLLGQALHNIRSQAPTQMPRSLSFEVRRRPTDRPESADTGSRKPRKARSDRYVEVTRTQEFQVAVVGVIKSKVPSLELDLLFRYQRCALSCELFPAVLNNDLLLALQNVRRLSLRFSDPVLHDYNKQDVASMQNRVINRDD